MCLFNFYMKPFSNKIEETKPDCLCDSNEILSTLCLTQVTMHTGNFRKGLDLDIISKSLKTIGWPQTLLPQEILATLIS